MRTLVPRRPSFTSQCVCRIMKKWSNSTPILWTRIIKRKRRNSKKRSSLFSKKLTKWGPERCMRRKSRGKRPNMQLLKRICCGPEWQHNMIAKREIPRLTSRRWTLRWMLIITKKSSRTWLKCPRPTQEKWQVWLTNMFLFRVPEDLMVPRIVVFYLIWRRDSWTSMGGQTPERVGWRNWLCQLKT